MLGPRIKTMVQIEELSTRAAPAAAAASSSTHTATEQPIGWGIAEAAAGMGPCVPGRIRAAAALEEALAFKLQGNECFGAGQFIEALEYYSDAIDAVDNECEERAVFYGNRAACYSNTGQHTDCVADCTAALALRPAYAKVLLRRAKAREALEEPDLALEDMRQIVEVALAGSKEAREAKAAIPRLEAAAGARMEAQKDEMLGKLKDLGNSVLGRFGLSLDNFKADKDPATGSYNISFGQ